MSSSGCSRPEGGRGPQGLGQVAVPDQEQDGVPRPVTWRSQKGGALSADGRWAGLPAATVGLHDLEVAALDLIDGVEQVRWEDVEAVDDHPQF